MGKKRTFKADKWNFDKGYHNLMRKEATKEEEKKMTEEKMNIARVQDERASAEVPENNKVLADKEE